MKFAEICEFCGRKIGLAISFEALKLKQKRYEKSALVSTKLKIKSAEICMFCGRRQGL